MYLYYSIACVYTIFRPTIIARNDEKEAINMKLINIKNVLILFNIFNIEMFMIFKNYL
jgi:hypothetical protein